MSDIFFLIDPSHLTSMTLFVCSFPAESTLYVWRDKEEVVGGKTLLLSKMFCLELLLWRLQVCVWHPCLAQTCKLGEFPGVALDRGTDSTSGSGAQNDSAEFHCQHFLKHFHGLCWLITLIYYVIRHKNDNETLNAQGKGDRAKWIADSSLSARIINNQRHRLFKKKTTWSPSITQKGSEMQIESKQS